MADAVFADVLIAFICLLNARRHAQFHCNPLCCELADAVDAVHAGGGGRPRHPLPLLHRGDLPSENSTSLLSDANFPNKIKFKAVCRMDLVTLSSRIGGNQTIVVHRVNLDYRVRILDLRIRVQAVRV